jgi:hypothetical protein
MKLLIDVNQISQEEAEQGERFKDAHGVWFLKNNSQVRDDTWKAFIKKVGVPVITEDGAFDRAELASTGRVGEARRQLLDLGLDCKFCMVYVERPDIRFYDADLNIYKPEAGKPIIVLCRNYAGENKAAIKQNLKNKNCGGVVFELKATGAWVNQIDLRRGIRDVITAGKRCFVLLTPQHPSINYRKDIAGAIRQIKRSPHWGSDKLYIVLCAYELENTGITFLGGPNSVEGAYQYIRDMK